MTADWRLGLPVLRVRGATLREPLLADAPALFAGLTTPGVVKFQSTPPERIAGFERFIAWVQHERRIGRHACYVIVPDGTGRAAGLIQSREIEPGFAVAEWGFALAEPLWGTGLFVACAEAVVDCVFRRIGVHRLEARAAAGNGRGNGVLRKLGAVPEGLLRRSFDNGTGVTDQVLWSIIGEDWTASRQALAYHMDDSLAVSPETEIVPPLGSARSPWQEALPELHGDRVTLRELLPSDAEALAPSIGDAEVRRYVPTLPPDPARGFERFVEWTHAQRAAGSSFWYAVVPDAGPHAGGLFQIHQREASLQIAEWGFAVARRYRSTGLFDRSARLLLDHLFGSMGVRRLEARVMVDNLRAAAVLRRLGAVEEGRLRRSFLLDGRYRDDGLWAILDADWAALPGSGPGSDPAALS